MWCKEQGNRCEARPLAMLHFSRSRDILVRQWIKLSTANVHASLPFQAGKMKAIFTTAARGVFGAVRAATFLLAATMLQGAEDAERGAGIRKAHARGRRIPQIIRNLQRFVPEIGVPDLTANDPVSG